ncbi:MAG TPA: ABC transporter substrate-binding protein [Candidatus Melainabacteria bacterium]|nr:ABC transporter substrate-binding protein [Candidatus Melainabacteria bacterium]
MKEAGFERRKSGWFYVKNPDKEPLSIRVATVTDFSDIGQVVAAYLEKAGVKAEFEIVEYSTLKDQYLKDGKFDTVLFSRSIGPVPDPRMFWSTSGSLNYSRYHSPTMDKLIAYGSSAATLAEKNSYNTRVGDILALESPWIYLARPDLLIVHNQRVKNVVFPGQTKEGLPWNNELLNARLWSISKQ